MILIIGLAFALAMFSCKESDPPKNESTITAFGKTAKVTGDPSIPYTDFNTAKGKLQEAMTALDTASAQNVEARDRYTGMLNRTGFAFLIKTGNAEPNADSNKSMTVGIDYLLNTNAVGEAPSIALAIRAKVITDNAFASVP